jgi:hypothetical protein
MENLIYEGFTIKVIHDENPWHPREDCDNMGTMVCFHGRYSIGDKDTGFTDPEDLNTFLKDTDCVYLPIYMYEHGGITISTGPFSCQWDSGQLGYIYATTERIKEWMIIKGKLSVKDKANALKSLESEVNTMDQFVTGEVYGYDIPGIDEGSCWGFFGSDHKESGLLDEAEGAIRYHIKYEREKKTRILKGLIKSNVPLEYRQKKLLTLKN